MLKLRTPHNQEKGFTLIELLVVIVIVGVLAAIAIPIFTSQRGKAQDAKVASDMNTLAIQAHTLLADPSKSVSDMNADSLNFVSSKGTVWGVSTDLGANTYCLAVASDAGDRFKTDTPLFYDSNKGRQTATQSGLCLSNPPVNFVGSADAPGDVGSISATVLNTSGNGPDGNLDSYVVTKSGNYKIEAWGAQGGTGNQGGLGAYATSTLKLNKNTSLKILVGKRSETSSYGAGGGGSFIVDSDNSPLVIAGGGGGDNDRGAQGYPGSTTRSGNGGDNPGSNGNASFGNNRAGAGFLTDAAGNNGAKSFLNGGAGSRSTNANYAKGGYGGGGPGGNTYGTNGGGGGYSGGGIGGFTTTSGGGGGGGGTFVRDTTYNGVFPSNFTTNNTDKANSGNGKVVITYLGS